MSHADIHPPIRIKCTLTEGCRGKLVKTGEMKKDKKKNKHVLKCTACGKTALD